MIGRSARRLIASFASGAAFLRAVVLGYDVCARTGMMLGGGHFLTEKGFDPHAFGGGIGAAAAAGALAIHDRERMAYVKHYFNADWPTRSLYHVMLNTAVGNEPVVQTILETMHLVAGSPKSEVESLKSEDQGEAQSGHR